MKRRERLEKRAGELGLMNKRKRRDEPPLVIPHQDNEVDERQRQDEAPPLVIPQQDNEVQQLVQNDVGGDCVQKGTDDCSPDNCHTLGY
ncbi:uncharacterized protein LOC123528555 isoform X2 [Mercenaria mercenaria]|uniref:uncharacterized protein LOC123528555 isoform X2 n=1 Tax=Mercenaria mercenaria TaxID=6596 RepID=UPI00234EF849|nr:uncharacterized protein LOC123528555 isoform X2 [Mercenaria mercenaria]